MNRKPNRLDGFDYSANGAYFITICVKDMKCVLGQIRADENENVGVGVLDDPKIVLSQKGSIVYDRIIKMNKIYSDIQARRFVIMPNHIHILILIDNWFNGSSGTPTPTNSKIAAYVSTLKRMTNKEIGENIWQRSYYDHIIRDDYDYMQHIQYIDENPKKWLLGKDEYYC